MKFIIKHKKKVAALVVAAAAFSATLSGYISEETVTKLIDLISEISN